MGKTKIPEGYSPKLNLYDTQAGIELIKKTFLEALSAMLRLRRVSAPLFVNPADGLNDDLNGVERAVRFDIPAIGGDAEVVHSLAKWKRYALGRYGFRPGRGIVTDMDAIRRDEELDNLHSIYVDQWDWEKVITREERNTETLKSTVRGIVDALYYTQQVVCARYEALEPYLKDGGVTFITSEELRRLYPDKTPKERENAFVREHGTTFLMQIGATLGDGTRHDGRAPDYDDWTMNGDILVYHPLLDCAFELSSMGIRVDAETLKKQLAAVHCENRLKLTYHRMLVNDEMPLTIGGGIGQSRTCMLLLNKAHIGEVQSSLWDAETLRVAEAAGVTLL